jgi:hypothetical protein
VLRPALGALLAGASEGISRWTRALTRAVDAIFFERLWRDGMHPDGDREWAREVIELARCQLDGAIESSPIPAARFYQLVAKAKQIFEGSARRQFPDVFAQPVSAQEEGAVSDEQHIE